MGCSSIAGLPPDLNSPVPIYTPGWREALWKLNVLPETITQCPSQGLNLDCQIWIGMHSRWDQCISKLWAYTGEKNNQTLNPPSPLPKDTWKMPFLLPIVMIMISAGVGLGDTWMARLGQKSSIVTEILHTQNVTITCMYLYIWCETHSTRRGKIKLLSNVWIFKES